VTPGPSEPGECSCPGSRARAAPHAPWGHGARSVPTATTSASDLIPIMSQNDHAGSTGRPVKLLITVLFDAIVLHVSVCHRSNLYPYILYKYLCTIYLPKVSILSRSSIVTIRVLVASPITV